MRPNFSSKLSTLQNPTLKFGALSGKKKKERKKKKNPWPDFNCYLYDQGFSVNLLFSSSVGFYILKITIEWKEKHNHFYVIVLCWVLTTNSQIMRANLIITYLSFYYIWGYRSLMITLLSTQMIWFPFPTFALIENWYPRIGYFPNKPNVKIWT
jgi:hypothetical protein